MSELLRRLYENREYRMKVYFEKTDGGRFRGYGKVASFRVEMAKDDCMVGNFGLNFWFRTKKGIDGKRYKSIGYMLGAIKQTALKHNLKLVGYRIYIEKGWNKRVIREGLYTNKYGWDEIESRWIFEL